MSSRGEGPDSWYDQNSDLNYPTDSFHGKSLAGCEVLARIDSYAPACANEMLPPSAVMTMMLRKGRKVTAKLPEQKTITTNIYPPYPTLYIAHNADVFPFQEYVIFKQRDTHIPFASLARAQESFAPFQFYAYCSFSGILRKERLPDTHMNAYDVMRKLRDSVFERTQQCDFITRMDIRGALISSADYNIAATGDEASVLISGSLTEL